MRSVLKGFLLVPSTYTDPCPARVLQPYNAAYFFLLVKAKGGQDPVPATYLNMGCSGGDARGLCPAVSLLPPHSRRPFGAISG